MNRLSALLLLLLLGLSQHIHAQVNVIAGLGATTCSRWIESRALNDKGVDNFLVAWVQGFLSGMNAQAGIGRTIPGEPRLLASIDGFCQKNPQEPVYAASLTLYSELSKQQ